MFAKTAMVIFAAVAALGAVGLITAIGSSAEDAHAVSCQQQSGGGSCNGCGDYTQGWTSSEGKCLHGP